MLDNWGNGGENFTRTIPFDKLHGVMTATQVQAMRESGQLIESHDKIGFFVGPKPSQPETPTEADPEQTLRALWDAEGVPKERQEEILADVTAKKRSQGRWSGHSKFETSV